MENPFVFFLIQFGIVVVPLALGFLIGTYRERSHFASIEKRETEYHDITVNNLRKITQPESIRSAQLLMADTVVATDYFKGFVAALRNIVGGRVRSYETLLERGRRESLLRLQEQARRAGCSELWNVRFETSNIMSGTRKTPSVSVEVFAYATAIARN